MDSALFQGDVVASRRILYTPSPFAKSSLIHLQEIGSLQAQKPHTSRRENLPSYLFFFVESGEGVLEYEGETFPLQAGDCVFLDCRRPYSHRSSETLWQLKWVHFYGASMGSIFAKYRERGGLPMFRPQSLAEYRRVWEELYKIASSSDHIRDMRIFEQLTALLTLLMAESWRGEDSTRPAMKRQNLQHIKEYLDEHFAEPITLDALAEQFFINKFYLTRVFKEQFGVSVHSYLQQVRITRAKQLLRFSDRSVEAIGAECGIGDANYFSRVFRQVEGISPSEFRRQW